MSYILTLVSSSSAVRLSGLHLEEAMRLLEEFRIGVTCAPVWLHPGKAADIGIDDAPDLRQINILRQMFHTGHIDCFANAVEGRRKKLLVADMDATIVHGETLDELAAVAGVKDQVAAITARAMNGEIDFAAALRERVALLEGLPVAALTQTLEKMRLNPGAEVLVKTMRHYKAMCVLVTGGFTFFSEAIARRAGFHHHHANTFETQGGVLTGRVKEPILDKEAKLESLNDYCRNLGIRPHAAMAIGDGANDLPMLRAAGLGVGYYPKRLVAEEIGNLIVHGDLSAALYAQGYTESHVREAMANEGTA